MASLTRVNICNAIESLFESDTTLYGPIGYINFITDRFVDFENSRIGIDKPYKMYLKCTRREKIEVRMGKNVDYAFTVLYRIEGLKSNPETAKEQIDIIDERIEHLCDNEMWTGNNLSSHFTNTECTIINIEWEASECDTRKDDGGWKVECEGSIRIEINRVKP